MRSSTRAPHAAGLDPVSVGGCVAHGLERVAPVAEVLRPVGDQLQLAGLDLGAVLFALEVLEAGHQLVGGTVEALGLGVEHVDETPEQALAFVAELRAVRSDALGEDAEGFAHRVDGVVGIPDVPAVELVALGRRAVERCVLAGCCCCGMFVGFDLFDGVHDDLPILSCTVRSVCPEVMVLWDTRARAGMNGLVRCASGAGAGSAATEPRSRAAPGLGASAPFHSESRPQRSAAEWRTPPEAGLAQ